MRENVSDLTAILINAGTMRTSIGLWPKFSTAPDPAPVAWISALLSPNSYALFEWQAVYEYVWANTGALFPGKTVNPAQRISPTPDLPAVRFQQGGSGYELVPFNPDPSLPAGRMLIETSSAVPVGQLTIGLNIRITAGLGQPGNAASVAQAQPNMAYRWSGPIDYHAGFGAMTSGEYAPEAFTLHQTLPLDFRDSNIVAIMLSETNVLTQLKFAGALKLLATGRFTDIHAIRDM